MGPEIGPRLGGSGGDGPNLAHEAADRLDPELATVVAAWPSMPAAVKAGIVAMVRAAGAAG